MEFEAARRQAAELILQDESLTGDLEDDEAQVLLRWALATADRRLDCLRQAGATLHREAVTAQVQPVRALARAVNDLMVEAPGLERAALLPRLLALLDAAGEVACGVLTPPV